MRCPGSAGAAAAGLIAAGFLLAGCSGGASGSSSAARAAPQHQAGGAAAAPGAQKPAAQPGKAAPPGGSGTTAKLAPAGRQLIYSADITVRARDVATAVAQATRITDSAGGYVASENSSGSRGHPALSAASLQLEIPVTAYPATLSKLGSSLGTQTSLSQQAQDVTRQVADTQSRVASDKAAIAQLRALLSHAGSVSDLLSVQNQIDTEESSLESLQAQQQALNHETAYATVSLALVAPPAAAPHRPNRAPGPAAGLGAGWHALRVTLSWLVVALGAIAPLGLAAVLIGYLAWLLMRWFTRRRTPPPAPPSAQ